MVDSEPGDSSGEPGPSGYRGLVPIEIVALLLVAIVPLPDAVPVALPLVAIASLSRWIRRRGWGEVARGGVANMAVGALAGSIALGVALVAGAPAIEALSDRAIEWSSYPIVRGNARVFAIVGLIVVATAIATELALRGWIVERMLELAPGPAFLPVFVGAVAEALITPGDLAARLGAGLFGAGLGWMYVAGGRSVLAPICARLVFQLGALLLESMRLIG